MKKENQKNLYISLYMLIAFILWTIALHFINVKAIGPCDSTVGFADINGFIHNFTGVNMTLYTITDWLGIVPLLFMVGFAILGLSQWIKRKQLRKVDYTILILGGFYIIVIMVYFIFEIFVVNYRPVLINGYLEASYPSSTTMLVMCVMPTSIMQFNSRIKNHMARNIISLTISAFIVFMVVARFISGVHWFSDIVGGVIISISLVMMYRFLSNLKKFN